jgi:hypothetical protein
LKKSEKSQSNDSPPTTRSYNTPGSKFKNFLTEVSL